MPTPRLVFLHALSPLHAGTGQSYGAVDLAIARERATQLPYLPGSSLKGALRAATPDSSRWKHGLFGPETANASDHAGAVVFGDAHLLLLPVRSLYGTFAWVTSPYLLNRFARDASAAGLTLQFAAHPGNAALVNQGAAISKDGRIFLEELDFACSPSGDVAILADMLAGRLFADAYWRSFFAQRLCVLPDDVLGFFARHATEVVTRVALDSDTKTVKDGQLWTEENLPAESVLVSLVEDLSMPAALRLVPDPLAELAKAFDGKCAQLGGKASVGRGRCALRFHGGA